MDLIAGMSVILALLNETVFVSGVRVMSDIMTGMICHEPTDV